MFRSVAVAVLTLVVSTPAVAGAKIPAVYHDPVVAIPLNRSLLENESALACFSRLLTLGAYGQRSEERAAFLILRDGQPRTFACMLWPAQHTFMREQWTGRIPDGTVAILHTHPASNPDPSAHDAMEARRLGIPIFVITPGAIEIAQPDERFVILLHEPGWWKQDSHVARRNQGR